MKNNPSKQTLKLNEKADKLTQCQHNPYVLVSI